MALIKNKLVECFGITASYWRVEKISIDTKKNEISFSMELYVDKAAPRSIEAMFISDLIVANNPEVFDKYFRDLGVTYKDIYTACYNYVKENVEFFKDAIDDKEEVQRREALRK